MLRSIPAVLLTGASLLAQQAPRYTIHDLGRIGPMNAAVTGLNIHGQVIGFDTMADGTVRSFRTAPNAEIDWSTDDLGSFGGSVTHAYGINSSGQVVGSSTSASGDVRGFRTAANKRIQGPADDLGPPGTVARAINDAGQVTGISGTGFITSPNSPINPATDAIDLKLVSSSPYQSEGMSINDRGHVLGQRHQAFGYLGAFVHTERAPYMDPGFVRFSWENYTGINNQDQVVGGGGTLLDVWQPGKKRTLAICPVSCIAVDLNNALQVVGMSETNPILYSNGRLYDLTKLIQNGSDWVLPFGSSTTSSYRINDLGQIAGVGLLNNEPHAFRLDPEPSAANAIQQALIAVRSLSLDRRARNTLPLMLKATMASKLTAALDSWSQGNPAAARGFLNEFENVVRAHTGTSLSREQGDRLLEMAEAAINMT